MVMPPGVGGHDEEGGERCSRSRERARTGAEGRHALESPLGRSVA